MPAHLRAFAQWQAAKKGPVWPARGHTGQKGKGIGFD